ncbi:MAG: hypothetical protein EOP84_30255, partial [Verrucomicrobiaceae bacterium]
TDVDEDLLSPEESKERKIMTLLLKIKNREISQTTGTLNLLLRCNDHLKLMVSTLIGDLDASVDSRELILEVSAASRGELVEPTHESEPAEVAESPTDHTSEFFSGSVEESSSIPSSDAFHEPDQAAVQAAFEETVLAAGSTVTPPTSPAVVSSGSESESDLVDQISELLASATQLSMEEQFLRAQQEFDEKSKTQDALIGTPTPSAVSPPEASAPVASTAVASAVAAAPNPTPHVDPAAKKSHTPPTDDSIRVSLTRLEKLLNYVGEMVILQSVLQEQSANVEALALRKTVHQLGKVTKEVQDISMSLRMVPVKQTFQKMQRIVRDTAQMLSKKVNLHLKGEETELDKTVLEHLGDPLVHIIRNAVDHGVESSEKRLERGKPEQGNVHLSAYHEGGRLVIEIRDDGGGIPGE